MILVILIALTAWLLGLFLPWWSVIIPSLFFGGVLGKKSGSSFLYGFLAIGGLWLVQTIIIDISNGGILSERIAELFNLPAGLLVILLTAIIGGMAGGLGTLTGYLGRQLIGGLSSASKS